MRPSLLLMILPLAVLRAGDAPPTAAVVKVIDTCADMPWVQGAWVSAGGTVQLVEDAPPGAEFAKSIEVEARFPGKGFAFYNAEPARPLLVPGMLKTLSVWHRGPGATITLVDGWNRSEVDGKKLEWNLASTDGAWRQSAWTIPATWVQPIRVSGLAVHNWGEDSKIQTKRIHLSRLVATYDLRDTDPATGALRGWKPDPDAPSRKDAPKECPRAALLGLGLTTGRDANLFAGEAAGITISANSWMAGKLTGTLTWSLTDLSTGAPAQAPLAAGSIPVQVDDRPISQILPLSTPHQGLYRFDADMVWAGGGRDVRSLTLATIGAVPAYDAASREASPYGLNTHGGRSVNSPEAWNKAGLVWIRDYAWAFSAMLHARDEHGEFTGWPWYPKLLDRYTKHGLRLLPCLFDGIIPSDGTVPQVPVQWRRDMSAIFAAFPSLTVWELGNEWDLDAKEKHGGKLDRAKGFPSYRASHKAFGQIVSAIGATAVENGRSGCYPDDIRAMVVDGTFSDIQVTNGHFYTGTATPELSISNANTAGGGTGLKYRICYQDLLRECQRASRADGKKRSFWLSEFGYDTKAGFVVSPFQQAIYLQRAWMLSFANRVEKSFWFYDYDESKSDAFFDGCGIMDETAQPKLSLCTLSALTRILPNPSYVGPLDAGPGTWGYLFEDHGKRVAAMWMVDQEEGPQVTFSSGRLIDFLGNPIAGNTVKLGLAPVFCVDVAPGDRWVKQACYEVDGLRFLDLSAGDTFKIPVAVSNHRSEALKGRLKLRLPEGWSSPTDDLMVEAAPGAQARAEFACVIAPNARPGEFQVGVQIDEGGILCELQVRVLVRPAISISAPTLGNQPGATATAITVVNYSQRALDGVVTLQLPAGWKAEPTSLKLEQLAPDATRSLPVTITWDGSWRSGEEAWAQIASKDGSTARVALQPGVITIPRLASFTADGELGEWPASALLPNWVIGCTSESGANADIHLGWCERGLAIAINARNSLAQGRGPSAFWNMDTTEVFIDSTGTFTQREFAATDHQFWLVPQLMEKRAYLGRWKRNNEIPATLYDIPGMTSFAKATPDGYLYEAVIPAERIHGFTPKIGAVLGLELVLSVNSTTGKREVYWPWSKNDNPAAKPQTWGRVRLGE